MEVKERAHNEVDRAKDGTQVAKCHHHVPLVVESKLIHYRYRIPGNNFVGAFCSDSLNLLLIEVVSICHLAWSVRVITAARLSFIFDIA